MDDNTDDLGIENALPTDDERDDDDGDSTNAEMHRELVELHRLGIDDIEPSADDPDDMTLFGDLADVDDETVEVETTEGVLP